MTVNGYELNTMFVERDDEGRITLFGSYLAENNGSLLVVRSTKNMPELATKIFGTAYTNEGFIEKLKERPTHNFIGNLSGPISMPISEDKIWYID